MASFRSPLRLCRILPRNKREGFRPLSSSRIIPATHLHFIGLPPPSQSPKESRTRGSDLPPPQTKDRKMYDENADCPSDAFYGFPVQPVIGNMSFHSLSTIVSAACTILAILFGLALAVSHLARYTQWQEQRQLVRISIVPAFISVFCFFGIWFNGTSGFLKPIGEYYESFALVSVFLLFLTFATPLHDRGQSIFGSLEILQERNGGANLSTYYVSFLISYRRMM